MTKTVLITGSTSGIGKGIAQVFASEKYNILLNGFGDEKEINLLKKEFHKKYAITVDYHPADLSKEKDIQAIVEYGYKKFNGIDIIINNAGIQHKDLTEDFPTEKWDKIIAINLSAAFHLSKKILPSMKKNNWGRIINIASAHGLVGSPYKSAYVAAKHGLIGLTKVMGLETAEHNITVNAICPGWVLTPLVEKQIYDLAQARQEPVEKSREFLLQEKQPSKKFVTIEQIGKLALFLSSEDAQQITGASYTIDGGWTAQ